MSAPESDLFGEVLKAAAAGLGDKLTADQVERLVKASELALPLVAAKLSSKDRCYAAIALGVFGLFLGLLSALGEVSFAWGTWGMALSGCAAAVLPTVCPWLKALVEVDQ